MNEHEGKPKLNILNMKYLFVIAALVLAILYSENIFSGVGTVWHIMFPLVLGGAIAYVLNIITVRLEKIYFPHTQNRLLNQSRAIACILLSMVLIICVVLLVAVVVVPEVIRTFTIMANALPPFIDGIVKHLSSDDRFPLLAQQLQEIKLDWNSILKNVWSYATQGIGGILNSTISVIGTLTSAIFNFVVALVFAIYILMSKHTLGIQIQNFMRAFLKKEQITKINKVVSVANESFSSYIIGQCTEALVLGTLCTLGLMVFNFPYPLTIGVFIGATALIPMFGAYLGAAVGVLLIMVVDPIRALLFIVFILVLQQLESNLIYPKVVGSSIGLPGMWVLAAVIIGGGLGGVLGMVLGVPIAATIYKLLQIAVRERLSKNKIASK